MYDAVSEYKVFHLLIWASQLGCAYVYVLVAQSYSALYSSMDCSLLVSSVIGIL